MLTTTILLLITIAIIVIVYLQPTIKGKLKPYLQKRAVKIFTFTMTLALTMMGFLLSMGNDYFAQYDYKPLVILKDLIQTKKTVNYEDIRDDSEMDNPKYYFILDVSESIKDKSNSVDLNDNIKDQIKAIKKSAYCPHKGYDFGITEDSKKIDFNRLLQVRLMYSLLKLQDTQKDKMDYSIILFSSNPEICPEKDIKKTFGIIYNQKFDGKESNFVGLFEFLQDNIISSFGPTNYYKRRECHLIFFSDFLHDNKSKEIEADLKEDFSRFMWELQKKNIDIKLYYSDKPKQSNTSSHTKGLFVSELFSSVYPFLKVEALDADSGFACPMISKTPIPIRYSNSLFEEELKTSIRFKGFGKQEGLSLGLKYGPENYNDMKQNYYLINGTDTLPLSSNMQSISIDERDNVSLMIRGYIPAPYKSPDVVIQDSKEEMQYIVPVAFYKKIPRTGWILLYIIGVLLTFQIMVFPYIIKRVK